MDKKEFLTEKASAIIENKIPVKFKDLDRPTISVTIEDTHIDKALLDLDTSVNLRSYLVYKQFDELKKTNITLSLANSFVKVPTGIMENALVQVDNFFYSIDFVVFNIEPSTRGTNHVPIILERPFLATSNVLINCRNGFM